MISILIDEEGYIDNPHAAHPTAVGSNQLWAAIVCRRGKKTHILSFLDIKDRGRKVDIRGIPRNVYLEFGAAKEKERSLYVVDQVTESVISLRSVDTSELPRIYDIETIVPTKIYILEAELGLLELQLEGLRSGIADMKRESAALPEITR